MSTSSPDLSSLLRQTGTDSHEDILKAANSALKHSKTNITAHHARVVALLKLERYDDALRAFDEAGDALKEKAKLEYAYALYKAGEWEKAEQVAAVGASAGERGLLHVAGQTTYRAEKFDKSAQIYDQLSKPSADADAEVNDLRIQKSAVDAQLEWSGKGYLVRNKKPRREDLEAFETAYNAACASIARSEFGQAEVLLKRAKQLCSASPDLAEEDKRSELLPILVQEVYVLSNLGREAEAAKLCETIPISDISDPATKHMAQVNSLAASNHSNPYLAHRLFHSTSTLSKTHQPFEYQSSVLRQNTYALDLQSLKYSGVARSTSALISSQPSPTTSSVNTLSVLNAAAHARNSTGKQALKTILPLLDTRPTDVGLILTIIKLYVLGNNSSAAISLLESFLAKLDQSKSSDQEVRFAPGLVGTQVSLYQLQGRKSQIKTTLAAAAEYWRKKGDSAKTESATFHPFLLKAAGATLLETGVKDDAVEAAKLFSNLHTYDPNDRTYTAGLVGAFALSDPSKITPELVESLTPAAKLVSDVDAAALEDAGIPRLPTQLLGGAGKSKKRTADDVAADEQKQQQPTTKKKKLPKSRTPKDYVEGKKMDPERWLPLRDRSSWKPKGRKGKARAAGLTQGGIATEEKEKTAQTDVVKGSAGGSSSKKKKKGKGGKW